MSAILTGISALANTGLEAAAFAEGEPVSVNTTTVAGVPVTSTNVGGAFSGSTGTLLIFAIVAIAGLLIWYLIKRKA